MSENFDLSVAPMDAASTTKRAITDWTAPAVYPTGGYVIDPNDVRMGKIFAILFSNPTTTVANVGYVWGFDQQTGAIVLVDANTGLEAANGTDVNGTVVRMEVIGQ